VPDDLITALGFPSPTSPDVPAPEITVIDDGKPVSSPRIDTSTLSAAMLVQIAAQMGMMSDFYTDRRSRGITRAYPLNVTAVPTWLEFPDKVQGVQVINDGPNPVALCTNSVVPHPHWIAVGEERHIAVETHEIERVVAWCARGNVSTIRLETIE